MNDEPEKEKDPLLETADEFGSFGLTGIAGMTEDIEDFLGL